MKKVLALMLALVLVLSLAACGGGISAGTYKVTKSSGSMDMFKDVTTLEVKEDGTASLIVVLGEDLKDTTEVKFDKEKGIVTFDESEAKYTVDGNKITFIWDDGTEWVFEK